MLTTMMLALTLTSLKLEAPQFQKAPKMELDLPSVPKLEALEGPAKSRVELNLRKGEETGTLQASPVKVEEIQIAQAFVQGSRGLRALEPVDTFLLAAAPAQLPSFRACVRVASPDRMPARVRVQLRLPGGAEVASVSRSVSFEKEWADVVFDFANLKVAHGGTYKLVVTLDGEFAAEAPLEVRVLKQAAVSSGR